MRSARRRGGRDESPWPQVSPASPPPQGSLTHGLPQLRARARGLYAPLAFRIFFFPRLYLLAFRCLVRREAKLELSSDSKRCGEMKIQCDACEGAAATVVCCADEAALCARCDVEIHAANKLASKHQRLPLEALSARLPRCDVCQVRDRSMPPRTHICRYSVAVLFR
jgi:hypothetical protein